MWSEEEVRQITALCGRADPLTDALAVATRAVDLVAARGGTMTANPLSQLLGQVAAGTSSSHGAARLGEHLTAQGARCATLEAENARLVERTAYLEGALGDRTKSYQQALKEAEGLSANLTEACRKADKQREREEAAERALEAERIGDMQMKHDFGALPEETLRGMVARIAKERDAATQLAAHRLKGRMDAASEAERLRAERDAYRGRAEDAESRLQRMRDGIMAISNRCVDMAKAVGEPCPAHGYSTRCGQPAGHPGDHVFLPVRYPCSPTCTHDDAAMPGHQERVRERSEALAHGLAAYDEAAQDAALSQRYEDGKEDMRAACWEVVQERLRAMGIMDPSVFSGLKAAIEGAAP